MEIFVSCSSSDYIDKKYIDLAGKVGLLIAKNGHNLIFGSSEHGMMGEVFKAVKENGGKVTAILPKEFRGYLMDVDANTTIDTETSLDQLKLLVKSGDVTIVLPGSYGTLSELLCSIHSKKLGEHKKRIFILNAYGYYDEILNLFEKIYLEKFDFYDKNELFKVVNTPEEIFEELKKAIV